VPAVSRSSGSISIIVRVVFVILLAFLVLASPVLFLIFFVPVVTWYILSLNDKNKKLEERLAALEGPSAKKPEKN
jgi:hypothetical protein